MSALVVEHDAIVDEFEIGDLVGEGREILKKAVLGH